MCGLLHKYFGNLVAAAAYNHGSRTGIVHAHTLEGEVFCRSLGSVGYGRFHSAAVAQRHGEICVLVFYHGFAVGHVIERPGRDVHHVEVFLTLFLGDGAGYGGAVGGGEVEVHHPAVVEFEVLVAEGRLRGAGAGFKVGREVERYAVAAVAEVSGCA